MLEQFFGLKVLEVSIVGVLEVRYCIILGIIFSQALFAFRVFAELCHTVNSLRHLLLNYLPIAVILASLFLVPASDTIVSQYAAAAYFTTICHFSFITMRLLMCILAKARFPSFHFEPCVLLPYAVASRLGVASVELGIATLVISVLMLLWFLIENSWHLQKYLKFATWTIPFGTKRKSLLY